MPSVSYDGHSLLIDSQRIWLVCGEMDYARIPHALWRSRIRAARQAGLNAIATRVFWNFHERQPGMFQFSDDADLRRFVQIIDEEGLFCILRPGPFVGGHWDMGGLPAWLIEQPDIALRQANSSYMAACARYLDAVMQQVSDLQVTNGGPLLLIQCEDEWLCHNDQQGEAYLFELTRYLRESGCAVPVISCNNLWQPVDGVLETWAGWDEVLQHTRQLRLAQPEAPRIIGRLPVGEPAQWNRAQPRRDPDQVLRTLGRISGAGGQFCLSPFHGGTNFGFYAGRNIGDDDCFVTTGFDCDAPLGEAGRRGPNYLAVKRIATFLSAFDFVMTNLRPSEHHAVPAGGLSVVQQTGSQGSVVFVSRQPDDDQQAVDLLMPDGTTLTVHLGNDPLAWLLMNVNLRGRGRLDLTNLRPWAFVDDQMLVLFGPAGSEGLVSIDGAAEHVQVPTGQTPRVIDLPNLRLVVLNDQQVDAAYVLDDQALYVGVGGFDEDDQPLGHPDFGSYRVVESTGKVTRRPGGKPAGAPSAPKLNQWQHYLPRDYVDGSATRYASLDRPRSLEACGADFGYGWYRVRLKRKQAGRVNLMLGQAGDRLHVYRQGKLEQVIGVGPGARPQPATIQLAQGEQDLVFLADNLGRFFTGQAIDQRKGLTGHLLNVRRKRLNKPDRQVAPMPDPFELTGYVYLGRRGDHSRRPRYSFKVNHRRKSPLVLLLSGSRPASMILLNDQPISLDNTPGLTRHILLDPEQLRRGGNTITLALLTDEPEGFDPADHMDLYETSQVISEDAEWSYARWQIPDLSLFSAMPRRSASLPTWYRCQFSIKHTQVPLWLDTRGLSKGQIYLNGRNVGRYFTATPTGKVVGPQTRFYLPEPWLQTESANELIIFDEHGKQPTQCKLGYRE